MYRMLALVLFVAAVTLMAANRWSASAQTPSVPSSVTPEATGTAPAAPETPKVEATATPFVWPTPASTVLSSTASLTGHVLQDTDGSATASPGDVPAETLIELVRYGGGFSVFTASDGSFAFRNLPSGDYLLMAWWTPSFIGVPTWETNPGLYVAGISVAEDGVVKGALPSPLLVKPKPEGLVPFPVRTGSENLPVGVVDGGAGSGSAAALPPTGAGPDGSVRSGVLKFAFLGLVVAAGSLVILRRSVRRR